MRIGQLTEAVHLGALDEDAIIYIHKIDSSYNLRMYSRVGRRNPLYCTAIGRFYSLGKMKNPFVWH